tara:strand:+ start:13 stop:396 length:384 start_codon:yes stop_codon:yes gene_type:complete
MTVKTKEKRGEVEECISYLSEANLSSDQRYCVNVLVQALAESLERRLTRLAEKYVSYECVYENTYRPKENETTHVSNLCEMQDEELGYPLERLIDDIEKYGKAVIRIGYATTTITPKIITNEKQEDK